MKTLIIRFNNWEYWPFWILYIPVFLNWIVSSIRLKSFLYFTTINPRIETGGFVKESKMKILKQIPEIYIPTSILIDKEEHFELILTKIKEAKITFPLVAKPDVGERGYNVSICETEDELKDYFRSSDEEVIIQEFIHYPIELAILYYKHPNEDEGVISSICRKEFLSVTGNGQDNVETLMRKSDRAILQLDRFEKEKSKLLKHIPEDGQLLVIEPVGNHKKGTAFLDGNNLIDEELVRAFNRLCNTIPDLNYGRFDIKCRSIDDLKKLEHFAIMEINGVSGEPAHIYDPKNSFFNAGKVLLTHWKVLFNLSKIQIENGIKPMKVGDFIRHLKKA